MRSATYISTYRRVKEFIPAPWLLPVQEISFLLLKHGLPRNERLWIGYDPASGLSECVKFLEEMDEEIKEFSL